MPQMNKGGKFIFGKSLIRTDGILQMKEKYIFLPEVRLPAVSALLAKIFYTRQNLVIF